MSSLRLKATGERLVWQDLGYSGEELLAPAGEIYSWYARADSLGAAAYETSGDSDLDDDDLKFIVPIFALENAEGINVEATKILCEQALISAGIAEEEEPFPSD